MANGLRARPAYLRRLDAKSMRSKSHDWFNFLNSNSFILKKLKVDAKFVQL